MTTEQMREWGGQFGKEYTDRNPLSVEEMDSLYLGNFGITRTEMNDRFVNSLDKDIKILEVGSNVGVQLMYLQKAGFKHLYGIELQSYAVELSRSRTKNINIMLGSAFDIPFKDAFFELVFTSGVLIHISPSDISKALDEIYRCTSRYIWGCEYFAETYKEISYRGRNNLLWKTNFAKLFLDRFKALTLVKEERFKYLNSDNVDTMYLLKKGK